jgi:hypothetical protein
MKTPFGAAFNSRSPTFFSVDQVLGLINRCHRGWFCRCGFADYVRLYVCEEEDCGSYCISRLLWIWPPAVVTGLTLFLFQFRFGSSIWILDYNVSVVYSSFFGFVVFDFGSI